MPNVLEHLAQHRDYLDDAAPPLTLGEVTDRAGRSVLRVPIRNRAHAFVQRPWWASGWAVAAATAVVVLLLGGGALLFITSADHTGPADTPPSLPPQITESLEPAPPPGPALAFESIQPRVDGKSVIVADTGEPVVAVPGDGLPVIAFVDQENGLVMVAKCGDPDCTAESSVSTVAMGSGPLAMAVGPQANPAIVYTEMPEYPSTLRLVLCSDPECRQTTTVDFGSGDSPIVGVNADGVPLVLYTDGETNDLVMFTCGTASCESPSRTILDSRMFGGSAAFTLRDDGRPIIAGVEEGNLVGEEDNKLSFYLCDDAACTSGSTSMTPVIAQSLSVWPLTVNPISLDPDGYPVTVLERYPIPPPRNPSPEDMDMTLHYVRCGDPACADTAAITEVQIHGAPRWADSYGASVVIDGDGLPVITYITGITRSDLFVARCDNISCTGGVEIQNLASCVWLRATLAVGGSGTPLVAYQLNPFERDGSVRLLPIGSAPDPSGTCAGGEGG